MSFIERFFLVCPSLGVSIIRGSSVYSSILMSYKCSVLYIVMHGTLFLSQPSKHCYCSCCVISMLHLCCTVEPPNKGPIGTKCFVLYREVSFIRRLKCTGIIGTGMILYREVSFIGGSTVYASPGRCCHICHRL